MAFMLAAFIDVIVFLLAYASGPFFFGAPETRWVAAAAALDGADQQLFVRGLLRKASSGPQGLPRVELDSLSPGERQLCLVLGSRGLAALVVEEGRRAYLLDAAFHQRLVETLAERSLALRASAEAAWVTFLVQGRVVQCLSPVPSLALQSRRPSENLISEVFP
jgi:hypothetical protein